MLATKQRFESKFKKLSNGCWEWTAGYSSSGYGDFWYKHRAMSAHKVSYILYKGNVPDGKLVLHKCNNPRCVNPDHLYIGTQKDNTADSIVAGTHFDLNKSEVIHNTHTNLNTAKLSYDDVMQVRAMLSDGISEYIIKFIFNISRSTLWRLKNKLTYRKII